MGKVIKGQGSKAFWELEAKKEAELQEQKTHNDEAISVR